MTVPGRRARVRYDWWRAHHGFPTHPKWRAVARAANVPVSVAFHIAACLLDTASQSDPRGSISNFKPFDCAGILDVPVEKVEAVCGILRDIHWIEGHMLAEWDDRQPQREDTGAAFRAADYRSRKRSVTDEVVTHQKRDGPGLSRKPSVTNAVVTKSNAPDRDKDITTSSISEPREEPGEKPKGASEGSKSLLPTASLVRTLKASGWAP